MSRDEKIPGTNLSTAPVKESTDEAQKRFTSRVAVTAAVLAALAAISSSMAGSQLNESMLEQIRASDQWNLYQAKGIKRGLLQAKLDTLHAIDKTPADTDVANIERYAKEQEDIKAEATTHQKAAEDHQHRHHRFARAATCAQIAIALTAVALLTKRSWAWALALVGGAAGAAFLAMGLLGQ